MESVSNAKQNKLLEQKVRQVPNLLPQRYLRTSGSAERLLQPSTPHPLLMWNQQLHQLHILMNWKLAVSLPIGVLASDVNDYSLVDWIERSRVNLRRGSNLASRTFYPLLFLSCLSCLTSSTSPQMGTFNAQKTETTIAKNKRAENVMETVCRHRN